MHCPAVEIEINNTPAATDDLVALKGLAPAVAVTTPCRIRMTGGPAPVNTVVLTNPDHRLRFPGDGDTMLTIALPTDGSWASFDIAGANGSAALNDATIEVHCETAAGALLLSKPVTVFWFDDAHIDVTVGGNYSVTGGSFTVAGAHAVDFSARARIRPAGVDCTAPQIRDLRVGIMQNTSPPRGRTRLFGPPVMAWLPAAASGTRVTIPARVQTVTVVAQVSNDSESTVAPLYDQPGKGGTLDPNSLKPPNGCAGGGNATSFDTPSTPIPGPLAVPVTDGAGHALGTATYPFEKLLHKDNFTTWVVIWNVATSSLKELRQRPWTLDMDTSDLAKRRPGVGAEAAASAAPVTAAPFSNDRSNDPANLTTGPVPGVTINVVKP